MSERFPVREAAADVGYAAVIKRLVYAAAEDKGARRWERGKVTSEQAATPADFELHNMVGHLIRVTQQVHFSLWGDGIGEDHLTSPQFAVLHVLAHQQPLDQRTLGDRASLDRSTVTDIVGRLAKRGILERTHDPADARRRLVRLTGHGLMVHRAAAIRAIAINESLLEAIDDDERDSLLRILNKILDHHNE